MCRVQTCVTAHAFLAPLRSLEHAHSRSQGLRFFLVLRRVTLRSVSAGGSQGIFLVFGELEIWEITTASLSFT